MAKSGKKGLDIIFEDEDFVILHKAANVLSIPDRFDAEKPNLYHLLQQRYENIFIVHRLDRATSGIICFARNEAAHKNLSKQFFDHTVDKIYLALVDGQVHPTEGLIDKPIAKHPTIPGKMCINRKGKASFTSYKVIETFKNFNLVEANIKTGRTHQIRIHFESIGYPLAVDELYGRQSAFFLSNVKLRKYKIHKEAEERPLMSRTSLHSSRLSLNHPVSGERLIFEVPLPKDFNAVLKQLRKWGT